MVMSLNYISRQMSGKLARKTVKKVIYICPNTILAHWIYLIVAGLILAVAYVLFMKEYYHLHEEYLESIKNKAF